MNILDNIVHGLFNDPYLMILLSHFGLTTEVEIGDSVNQGRG